MIFIFTAMNSVINKITKERGYLRFQIIKTFARCFGDRQYLEMIFPLRSGYKLNLDNPKTYNEKLQWLKLYDHRPEYSLMVDKIEAKKYVAKIIGREHIIPTLDIYDRVEDINFNLLPNKFVLKCTHDSGGLVICRDKSKLNIERCKKVLKRGLKRNYFFQNREWPYKNVKPRIIAEEYMVDESGYELKDYKWFCFDGEPKALFIATDRGNKKEETKFDFYDMDFHHLPFTNGHPNSSKEIKKPIGFDTMKEIAGKLSKGLPQVRVDLYDINGKIFFGELTFFHWSGMKPFVPQKWDEIFGDWITLPEKRL